ncbi:SCO-spondin-like isoform X1 [Pseudopipra pipra]|uniref:SCO-spondin-like isoform X1 n=1 Tax=Pseudopipra pipra TaxID=415032 RepID=UPI003139A023
MRKSRLAWPAPAPAEFKSQPIAQKHSIDRSAMLGQHSLLLVLLALLALAQQHGRGDQGTAPTFSAAPQGHWTPTASPALPKAGECPAGASGAPWPPGLYCLSDHSCPGAEKCCQSGQVWTCLLPTTESPGYCPRAGSAIGPSCGASCHNDTTCHSGEKCCTRGCCTRCVHAEPAKPWFCPRKRAQRSAAACPNRCTDDRDCPGDHKCCFSGCGLACAPPDTGTAPPALPDPHVQPTTALGVARLSLPCGARRVPGPAAGQAAAAVPSRVCSWWQPSRPQGACATGCGSRCHTPALAPAQALLSPWARAGPQDPCMQLLYHGGVMVPNMHRAEPPPAPTSCTLLRLPAGGTTARVVPHHSTYQLASHIGL